MVVVLVAEAVVGMAEVLGTMELDWLGSMDAFGGGWTRGKLVGPVMELCIFTGGSLVCWPYSMYCTHSK